MYFVVFKKQLADLNKSHYALRSNLIHQDAGNLCKGESIVESIYDKYFYCSYYLGYSKS